jgi:Signal transduction histidine kinase regulating citrate/malate metabolism
MNRMIMRLAGIGLALASMAVSAGEFATVDEAKALVKKATAYVDKNGREKAFDEFSKSPGPFVDRDLYVVVYDMEGLALAHPNPKWRGKNMMELRDQSGHNWVKERTELAKTQSSGLQDTQIFNPITKKVEPKRVYWERHGDLIIASGAYIK